MCLNTNSVIIVSKVYNFWFSFTDLYFLILDQILSIFGSFWVITTAGVALNFGFFLVFSGLIFSIGVFGIAFNRKNVLLLMASVEIMFLGINLVFISGYVFLNLEVGLVYALISLSIAAAEAAIGFGLLMGSFRNRQDITFTGFNRLKG
jgi:NADH-quinone oxidoreductase subunit K